MHNPLRLDDNISKERRFELAKKFIRFRKYNNKQYFYLRNYNITVEEVEALKVGQNHCCAICKKKLIKGKKTHVDHNHYTGKVRGILCSNCNLGLGMFKDDITSLENAAIYLRDNDG